MTEIFPFLYLGNESDAKDLEKLDELGIYHILNVTKNIPFYDQNQEKSKKFSFKRISVNDSTGESLMQHFDEAFSFIGIIFKKKLNFFNFIVNKMRQKKLNQNVSFTVKLVYHDLRL